MKRKRYTVVLMCMCGSCDNQAEIYWVLASNRAAAEDNAIRKSGEMVDPEAIVIFPGWIEGARD
jgi:hypothetical protein